MQLDRVPVSGPVEIYQPTGPARSGQAAASGPAGLASLSVAHRPKFSGEYISSALAGGITNIPAHVARII
ncbi:unnamed protein product [Didymodactylos carnosus]|uniref:Uncharacterized protein n=2 Tax=Didymodactylos carnosus TaxID=1234261 RepID=A0A816BHG9_9BILA|nr:unnamed protein product [Didymodactylos carnosus]CAF4489528.1 unnamed protein product [Didymodactylos carnosus]